MKVVLLLLFFINVTIVYSNRSGRVVNLQQIQNRCLTHQSTAPRDRTCMTQKKLKMQITPNVEGANGLFYCLTYEKNIGPIYGFDTLVIQLHPDYDLQYSGANVIDYEFPSFKLYDVRVSEEYKGRFAIYSNNTAFKIYQVTINNEPQSCSYGRNKNRQKKWPEEKEPEPEIENFETEAETFHETPKNVLSAIAETPSSSSSSTTSTTTSTTPQPTTTTFVPSTTPELTTTTTTVRTTLSTSTTEAPQPSSTEQQQQKQQITENIPEVTSPKTIQKIKEPSDGEKEEEENDDVVDSSETLDPENDQNQHESDTNVENKPTVLKNEPETENKPEITSKLPEITSTTTVPTTTTKQPESTTLAQKQPELTTVKTTQRQRNRKPSLNSLQKQKERDPLKSKIETKLKELTTIKNVKDPEPTTENDQKHKEATTARTEHEHHPEPIIPTRPLNEDNCGIPQKIVDLKQYQMPYNPGQYPYASSIYHILDADDIFGNSYYKCSGTIINRRMILTSVNCVLDYNARLIDENNLIATVAQYKKDGQRTSSRTYDVEQVLPHENYNYKLENNIAALRLKRSIEFDDFVQPACLPEPSMDLEDDSVGKVVGFGKSNTLNEGEYNISLDDDCKDAPSTCKTINGNNTSGNVDSTDLGCGLYMNNSNHYIVIGVVSIIPHPLTQDLGCIFTNILFYLDWINRLLI